MRLVPRSRSVTVMMSLWKVNLCVEARFLLFWFSCEAAAQVTSVSCVPGSASLSFEALATAAVEASGLEQGRRPARASKGSNSDGRSGGRRRDVENQGDMHLAGCSDGEGGEETLDGAGEGGGAQSPEDHGGGGGGGHTSCNGSGGSQSGSLLGVEWSDAVCPPFLTLGWVSEAFVCWSSAVLSPRSLFSRGLTFPGSPA